MSFSVKSLREIEKLAAESSQSEAARLYFSAGAGSCKTPRYNEDAFDRYKIRPRMLRDVSQVNTSSDVLGRRVPVPFGVAPVGLMGLARHAGEIAAAKACAAEGCIMILSSVSTCTIEEVAGALPKAPAAMLWMQVYVFNDRSVTLDIVRRAEKCGFGAVVVTVDSPVAGLWKNCLSEDFPAIARNRSSNIPHETYKLLDPSLTFEDLKWLKNQTKLPLVAKGIMTGEDASLAVECGVSAILVSNHGGRQIEGVQATIDVLEEVAYAVRGSGVEVYMDGGVRTGSDIFRVLALGAKAVFIGRPVVWGLTIQGESGVRKVLQILKDEFQRTMQLAGAANINDIQKTMVCKTSNNCKL